jgi:hypothetical protein
VSTNPNPHAEAITGWLTAIATARGAEYAETVRRDLDSRRLDPDDYLSRLRAVAKAFGVKEPEATADEPSPTPSRSPAALVMEQKLRAAQGEQVGGLMIDALRAKFPDDAVLERMLRDLLTAHGVELESTPAPTTVTVEQPAPPPEQAKGPEPSAIRRQQAPSPQKPPREPARHGGFAKVYTAVLDQLMAEMPDPVFRAYVYGCRLADDTDSTFWLSHRTLALKAGYRRKETGKEALRLLCQAGIIRRTARGGPHRATTYQLVPVRELDFDRAKAVLQTYTGRPGLGARSRPDRGAQPPITGGAQPPTYSEEYSAGDGHRGPVVPLGPTHSDEDDPGVPGARVAPSLAAAPPGRTEPVTLKT